MLTVGYIINVLIIFSDLYELKLKTNLDPMHTVDQTCSSFYPSSYLASKMMVYQLANLQRKHNEATAPLNLYLEQISPPSILILGIPVI